MLVSIIVPVYNVEEFLRPCVDSLLSQIYSDIEILLIDDGSTDSSGKICDEYATADTRIKVFHKENGGLSSARNYGISHAAGDYLAFVDSDDYVTDDFIEKFMSAIRPGVDVVVCGLYKIWETGKLVKLENTDGEYDPTVFLGNNLMATDSIGNYIWNKIFSKRVIPFLKFPYGKLYEDIRTLYKVLIHCDKILIVSGCTYYYRQGRGGAITQSRLMNNRMSIESAYYDRFICIRDTPVFSKVDNKQYALDVIHGYVLFCGSSDFKVEELYYDVKEMSIEARKAADIGFAMRVTLFFCDHFPRIINLLFKIERAWLRKK